MKLHTRVMDVLLILIILAAAIQWAGPTIGKLEGWLFPVTTKAVLYNPSFYPPPDYRYKWQATATKTRGGCVFKEIQCYLGEADVKCKFEDPPQERETGEHIWNSLVINLDKTLVQEASHGFVAHQCAWRPWQTRTLFYGDSP